MNYSTLIAAVKILERAQLEVFRAENDSPAWKMLYHAGSYVKKQAEIALRGE